MSLMAEMRDLKVDYTVRRRMHQRKEHRERKSAKLV